MRVIVLLGFLPLIFVSFCCNNKNIDTQCISYNKKGVAYLNKFNNINDKNCIDSAILYLDSAINCDSSYLLPFYTKLNALLAINDYERAVVLNNYMIAHSDINSELWLNSGIFYEKLKKVDSANYCFGRADEAADIVLREDGLNESAMYTKVLATAFLKGRDAAIKLNNLYIQRVPKESFLNWNIDTLENFDRAKFIDSYGKIEPTTIKLN
jgi:tetratricopeptide (TPR) repeat protein